MELKLEDISLSNMESIVVRLTELLEKTTHPDVALHLASKVADWQERLVVAEELRKRTQVTHHEIGLINSGQIIEAIKSVRSRTGLGLGDAKHIVDTARGRVQPTY